MRFAFVVAAIASGVAVHAPFMVVAIARVMVVRALFVVALVTVIVAMAALLVVAVVTVPVRRRQADPSLRRVVSEQGRVLIRGSNPGDVLDQAGDCGRILFVVTAISGVVAIATTLMVVSVAGVVMVQVFLMGAAIAVPMTAAAPFVVAIVPVLVALRVPVMGASVT